ncbi:MAG TPA: type I methionyl aminopeptidase [Actinomycetota bacterium]|nr:type I methionyl aminopeptidase [Actinomycetota bacterium]
MILKKTPEQIEKMRRAGKALAEIHKELESAIKPGVAVKELDELAERSIRLRGAVPSFLGYRGFPATICASLNEVVVHGIPNGRKLEEGDIFSVDLGLILDGWHADRAHTYPVGQIDEKSQKLLDVTERSLHAGIEKCVAGNHLSDISHAIQVEVEEEGFAIVREYAGHGIGRDMHEDPQVTNYGPPGRGPVLQAGMVFAIEPMVNAGTWETKLLKDGWTVVTADGSLSAHFEHTVAVTEGGPVVLTAP